MKRLSTDEFRELLTSDEIKNVILDTDAFNEVDDQFCLAYMLRSPDKIRLLSVCAAPFLNCRSDSPADGMEKSYNEIFRILRLAGSGEVPVFRGSERFLPDRRTPVESDAADNIIRTVLESSERVIIVAIAAITNVASALLKCPEIARRAAVVWLGGHSLLSPDNREFNFYQDISAAQVVFESGIPLLQMPCNGVCTELVTSVPELEFYLRGKNELCDYLIDIVAGECHGGYARSRIIWDASAAAALICPQGFEIIQLPKPEITDCGRYSPCITNPPYLLVLRLFRDKIYGDMFSRLAGK